MDEPITNSPPQSTTIPLSPQGNLPFHVHNGIDSAQVSFNDLILPPTFFSNPMAALGDTIYGGSAGVAVRLPGDTSNTKKFLSEQSVTGVATAPVWATIAAGDVPNLDASKITTGQLAQARGGTGKDTSGATDGQILIGKSSDNSLNLATITAGTGITVTNGAGSILITASSTSKFGGTGADGALSISSGTTQINCGGAQIVVKNYTSISITGTGKLQFINPHSQGTIIIIKYQTTATITSSGTPTIDASGMGTNGGGSVASGTGGSGADIATVLPFGRFITDAGLAIATAGRGGGANTGGGSGSSPILDGSAGAGPGGAGGISPQIPQIFLPYIKYALAPGSGGGAGGGGGAGSSGAGGVGGGALYMEGGDLNFGASATISVAGNNGGNAVTSGGGGGGGGGGMLHILYNTLTANSGSVTVTGGTKGTGTAGGVDGNNGPAGFSSISANLDFA